MPKLQKKSENSLSSDDKQKTSNFQKRLPLRCCGIAKCPKWLH